jgi:NitT/TauT family transport system ATP-binding protein
MDAPSTGTKGDAAVICEGVGKIWGAANGQVEALRGFSCKIYPGEIVAILGPSGCGKSTLLEIIAGLEIPTVGDVCVNGRAVSSPPDDCSLIYQDNSLFPWLTALQNVAFPLRLRNVQRSDRLEKATQMLTRVGLSEFSDKFPHELSGGMQQRVAIARALLKGTRVLLMDEPFGSLDSQTRSEMHSLLLQVWALAKPTILFVTHQMDEAILLSDRIYVMTPRPGHISQIVEVSLTRPRSDLTPDFLPIKARLTAATTIANTKQNAAA